MKKKYLKPVVEVYEMQLQGALLAGSSDPIKCTPEDTSVRDNELYLKAL